MIARHVATGVQTRASGTTQPGGAQMRPASTRPGDKRPEAVRHAGPTASHRGTGLVMVDPLDSEDLIKRRMRMLLSELRGSGLDALGEQDVGLEIGTLFDPDPEATGDVPTLSFLLRERGSLETFHERLRATHVMRQSDKACPDPCPFRELDENHGLHVHLTRPSGGPGDTILAVTFEEVGASSAKTPAERQADAERLRGGWMRQYSEFRRQRPIGRLFGARVLLGRPPADADFRLPN